MAATIIGNAPFGQLTNITVGRLISLNSTIPRLKEAIATASSGYDGVPGTEFEGSGGMMGGTPNLFSVQPDPSNAGQKGQDYSYAVNSLATAWETFWTAAQPFIDQLDNGTVAM